MATGIHQEFAQRVSFQAAELQPDRQEWIRVERPYVSLQSINQVCLSADIVVLAVKPQQLQSVVDQLSQPFRPNQLIVSMLAGVSIQTCVKAFDHSLVVRIMPNTPARLRCGVTGVFFSSDIQASMRDQCMSMLSSFGSVVHVANEDDLNVITAISGSGPAFFYRMVQSVVDFGMQHGLSQDQAFNAAVETMMGASQMLKNGQYPDELIAEVRSPNGTTQRGLSIMDDTHFDANMNQVLEGTYQRAIELSQRN